jgi:NAD(P)-dependent dehydrogenase (short-subunit alcohol dehydrogenase family)
MRAEQLFDVRGHRVIVTGAASGIGLAMTEVMVANGAVVMMLDIDGARLEENARRLGHAGVAIEHRIIDVRDSVALTQVIDEFAARHHRLDVMFANAGISAGPGYLEEVGQLANVQLSTWQNVVDINLTSVFVSVQAASRHMKARRSGRIIVTASVAGLRSEQICGYAYVATKAAVANLVRHAAVELAPHNVNVNAIAPGTFLTNIAGGKGHDPKVYKMLESLCPAGRVASTDEIKGLALLLASPASSYLTGAVIPIDGAASAA